MAEEQSRSIILDPSMLLYEPTFVLFRSLYDMNRNEGIQGLFLPSAFLQLVYSPASASEYLPVLDFFRPDRYATPLGTLYNFFNIHGEIFDIISYRASVDDENDIEMQRNLHSENGSIIGEIIYEEWKFLSTRSYLFSMVRNALDKMVNAGAKSVAFSRGEFERAVRQTLRLADNAELTAKDQLRAATKWVAFGGPAALSLIEPIAAALGTAVTGVFLYYDP